MNNAIKSFGWSAVALVLILFSVRGMVVTLDDLSKSGASLVMELLFVAATLSVGSIVLHLRQVRSDVRRSIRPLYLGMVTGIAGPIIASVYNVEPTTAHSIPWGFTWICVAAFFFNFLMLCLARECLKEEEAFPMTP
jgi:hypothetical protein